MIGLGRHLARQARPWLSLLRKRRFGILGSRVLEGLRRRISGGRALREGWAGADGYCGEPRSNAGHDLAAGKQLFVMNAHTLEVPFVGMAFWCMRDR